MKILMVSAFLPRVHGAGEAADEQAQRLGELLEDLDQDVYYFAKIPPDGSTGEKKTFLTKTLQESFLAKIPWMFDEVQSFNVLSDSISAKEFSRVLDQVKPEIVHFHHLLPLSLKLIDVTYFKMIPSILSMQDYRYLCLKRTLDRGPAGVCSDYGSSDCLECMKMENFKLTRKYLLEMRGIYFKQQLDKVDLFSVPSMVGKKHVVGAGFREDKIQVIPRLTNLHRDAGNCTADMGLIVFLGDISPSSGVDVALEAFKRVFSEIDRCRLALVGTETNSRYLEEKKQWVEAQHLQDQVKFVTRDNPKNTAQYLSRAEAVIVADQWPNMYNEKILSALAYGKPVVAGEIGNAPELIESGRTGFLVKYNDPEQYAKMLINVISNPEKSHNMGIYANSRFARMDSSATTAQKVLSIYQVLIETYKNRDNAFKKTGGTRLITGSARSKSGQANEDDF